MSPSLVRPIFLTIILFGIISACNFLTPRLDEGEIQATSVAMTLSAYGTLAVLPPDAFQTAIHSQPEDSAIEETTATALPFSPHPAGSGEGNALVLQDTLCYRGPGVGGVISSLKSGEIVLVIEQGFAGNWFAIQNPRYEIRCWVEKEALQFDSGFNSSMPAAATPTSTP